MFIESSAQISRFTMLKRFPVPRNFKLSSKSRIERGKTWPAPAGATRIKKFDIYRYDPDTSKNPRIDTYEVDLDDLRADGSGCAYQDQERDRFYAYLPPLLPRRHLRLMFNEYRWHELVGLHAVHIRHRGARNDLSSQPSKSRSRTWCPTSHIFMHSTA